MYNNLDFDINKVESIVYSFETVPDTEDYDINDYDTEDEMKEDMLFSYTFNVDFYDLYGERLNYTPLLLEYSEICEIFNEKIANEMINSMGIKRNGYEYELTIGVNTKPNSMSIEDVDEVAKRILPIVDEYYKGCRGFILYDGTIVNTESEHNMVVSIDGINSKFDFIKMGNIRILSDSIDIWKAPTKQQRIVLRNIINHFNNDTLYLDIDNIPVKYINPDYRQVLGDIDRYFDEGIKPVGRNNLHENTEEVTFYSFYTNIRIFLSKLLKKPFDAEPSKMLKDNGFTKTRLINLLLKKGVITRNEKVVVIDTDDNKKRVEHQLKYSVLRANFERKIKRIYIQFFEKNLPPKNINEDGVGGATSAACCNNSAPIMPLGSDVLTRPAIGVGKAGKIINNIDPTKINGKTINECKNMKKFIFTEEQIKEFTKRMIKEEGGATTTVSVGAETTRGDIGYDSPKAISINKKDPSLTKDGRSPKKDLESLYRKK